MTRGQTSGQVPGDRSQPDNRSELVKSDSDIGSTTECRQQQQRRSIDKEVPVTRVATSNGSVTLFLQ